MREHRGITGELKEGTPWDNRGSEEGSIMG